MVMLVMVSVSPVSIVTDEVSTTDQSNVPALLAGQNEISVTTSPDVPAQAGQAGLVALLTDPALGEFQVTPSRVVVEETLLVPAAPGDPVCSWTKVLAGLVTMTASIALAIAAVTPSAI